MSGNYHRGKTGVGLISDERLRQMIEEGFTLSHDEEHFAGGLALAGVCYALRERDRVMIHHGLNLVDKLWPWDNKWWKPSPDDRIKELTKAGALIAAEIDRLLALEKKEIKPGYTPPTFGA